MKSSWFTAVLALTVLASVEVWSHINIREVQRFVQERSQCACITKDELDNMIDDMIGNSGSSQPGAGCSNGYSSCQEVKKAMPNSPSGYYNLVVSGKNVKVYCSMDILCSNEGGWMRMAYLNMSDPSENCPAGFKLYEKNGVRACGRSRQVGDCQSAMFSSNDISYTQVCGRVIGYQKGSTDALHGNRQDIDQAYVDGVSITRGSKPREHIWTLVSGIQEHAVVHGGWNACPCTSKSPWYPRSFMGNDFFCESGCSGTWDYATIHTADPLWDGEQCGAIEKECCAASHGLPWFRKTIQQPTRDDIELRVCGDEAPSSEDVPVSFYEIYVQ